MKRGDSDDLERLLLCPYFHTILVEVD
ncbi:hypothetical protein JMJ77_0012753 [Colletotrichum scovillei]|uniref:Uncharacterized protein n=1 Tax=Colletotrichum scovillei TaxID=1209932 RepID=A0A9P7UEU5_9PEZI|nr:hypothetical protein JMJ77_0012753 [Colletotrichum scovillei]KAG7069034.1 hypothetical protein JMJ76_0002712 [Colletotrichum scovillei]KAG7072987.1 hypothetical protein JMJ78_0013970 [Colletotrichum scovillei]